MTNLLDWAAVARAERDEQARNRAEERAELEREHELTRAKLEKYAELVFVTLFGREDWDASVKAFAYEAHFSQLIGRIYIGGVKPPPDGCKIAVPFLTMIVEKNGTASLGFKGNSQPAMVIGKGHDLLKRAKTVEEVGSREMHERIVLAITESMTDTEKMWLSARLLALLDSLREGLETSREMWGRVFAGDLSIGALDGAEGFYGTPTVEEVIALWDTYHDIFGDDFADDDLTEAFKLYIAEPRNFPVRRDEDEDEETPRNEIDPFTLYRVSLQGKDADEWVVWPYPHHDDWWETLDGGKIVMARLFGIASIAQICVDADLADDLVRAGKLVRGPGRKIIIPDGVHTPATEPETEADNG